GRGRRARARARRVRGGRPGIRGAAGHVGVRARPRADARRAPRSRRRRRPVQRRQARRGTPGRDRRGTGGPRGPAASRPARGRRGPPAGGVRPDKAILAAVATTLNLYRTGNAVTQIPVWQLIARRVEDLRERAGWIAGTSGARVVDLESPVGGGSLPGQTLPSAGGAVRGPSPTRSAAALRAWPSPILAAVAAGGRRVGPRPVASRPTP